MSDGNDSADEEVAGAPFPLSQLGGNQVEIKRLHEIRPVWDHEVILEIFVCGGVPPLHKISAVRHNGKFLEVFFAIVQPNGGIVHDVKRPRSFMLHTYPQAMNSFERPKEKRPPSRKRSSRH
jgi:hypothetical protein